MWSDLAQPWQSCLELAWEAYCDDCIPIGAVVTGVDDDVLSRGRNRIFEKTKPLGVNGAPLAHAEIEALLGLVCDAVEPHTCSLYTTTEPCPMCMGAFYMSGVRTLHFAARDPWAGSINLLGKTPYLSRKAIKVTGPMAELEWVVMTLFAEQEFRFHHGTLPESPFWEMQEELIPALLAFAGQLAQSRVLENLKKSHVPCQEVMDWLFSQVKSTGRSFSPAGMEGHV